MFEKMVEAKIQEAMRNGEFDNLPLGKTIDLDEWASLPDHLRAGYMVLKNAGFAPEEVHLLKEIRELREWLARDDNQEEKPAVLKKLREAELNYNIFMELRKGKK